MNEDSNMTGGRLPDEPLPDEPLADDLAAALRALPRERAPGALLEERTVRAVRAAGVLGGDGGRWRVPPAWWAAGVAA
ncbi:hypothetical protein BH23GEM10_BH23GEM10_10330 [soil metagenome]